MQEDVNVGTAGHEDHVSLTADKDLTSAQIEAQLEKEDLIRKVDVQIRFMKGEDITRDEAIELFDLDQGKLDKMRNSKKNFRLRKILGKLTQKEIRQEQLDANKQDKINVGTSKIFGLIQRGIDNVTTA